MYTPFTLRSAQPHDADAILATHRDSVSALCHTHYSAQQIAMWLDGRSADSYQPAIAAGQIMLACDAQGVAGFVEFACGEIVKLFVRGRAAGQGVGHALMLAGIAGAEPGSGGLIRIESTRNAQPFYQRYGFAKVGEGVFSRGGSTVEIEVVMLERRAA